MGTRQALEPDLVSFEKSSSAKVLQPIKPNFIIWRPEQTQDVPDASLPKLKRSDYFCKPTISEMSAMSKKQLMQVDNFVIGRHGFGSIMWPGLTDVRNLDLDQIVEI